MHPDARKKIEKHVVGSLKNCDISEGWPVFDTYAPHVKVMASELLKNKNISQWLTEDDVFLVFCNQIYERLCEFEAQTSVLEGRLIDILDEAELLLLGQRIVDFFASIPREYEVYLQLPAVTVNLDTIEVSNILSVVTFEDKKDVPGGYRDDLLGLLDTRLELNKVYFRVAVSGYCSRSLDNSTVRNALSYFKIVTQQSIAKGLLNIKKNTPAGLGFLVGLSHHSVPKGQLVCVDKQCGGQRIFSIELPLEVSKLLGSLDLDKSKIELLPRLSETFGNLDKNNSKDKITSLSEWGTGKLLKSYLRPPADLMELDSPEACRVKSAIEWCFDSYATDNTTMSFLQTCFGLESLFGDEVESKDLNRTLADRCAYLIGNNIKARSNIRDSFKQLYSIRSKIVHGIASSLAPDQRRFLDWGRNVLECSIREEIKHLELPNS
jgi:hypothetical protein